MLVRSTKAFSKLACAHAQWFDENEDGSPGTCASLHGYDRTVKLTFAGDVDDHGWVMAFGKPLHPVKHFLEYYFDHTTLLPADDPHLNPEGALYSPEVFDSILLSNLRVLPYGVSMEMSSLFVWVHVNAWLQHQTSGRVYLQNVESIEHDHNAAFIEVGEMEAKNYARRYLKEHGAAGLLPKEKRWDFVKPRDVIANIQGR